MVIFSSDIDWAPEPVIEDMLELFQKYNLKCTLFCTHFSEVLVNCNRDLFEISVHPNFNPILHNRSSQTAKEVLEHILEIYPEAKGVRCHSMTQSSPLLDLFKNKGLLYDSNHFLPYNRNLYAYPIWNGLLKIPYNWEDDVHYMYGKRFDDCELVLSNSTLNVLDFHPIHVFLNTDCVETYQKAKIHYQNPEELIKFKNTTNLGVRDMLVRILEKTREDELENQTLLEFAHNEKTEFKLNQV
jgi:hypothetical protein